MVSQENPKDGMDDRWKKMLLPLDSTIQDAIHNLEQTALRLVVVLDHSERLFGTISDGDVRRGLLKGLALTSSIDGIVNRSPFVVPVGMPHQAVMQLMEANQVQQIPVVDEQRYVVGMHLWGRATVPALHQNMMVIMAGGKGVRLLPHTETCPKPLLPIAGKPMLEHIIERAKLEGFSHFVLAIHYLGHMIEEYFGNGERFNVRIDYLREDKPLGTAGALGLLGYMPDLPVVVTNGDVLTDIRYGDLLDFHMRYNASATIAVRLHEWQHPFGVVQTKGIEIVGFEEKPIARTHINAGVYVLSPDALAELEKGSPCDMPTLMERLKAKNKRMVAYPMHEPWLDVGRPEDLVEANKYQE